MKVFQSLGIVHRDLKPQNLLLCHSAESLVPAPIDLTLKIGQTLHFLALLYCFTHFGVYKILTLSNDNKFWFLRAKGVLAIAFLSVRPFVCLSVTWVDQSKTVQATITKSSPSAAWKTLVSETEKLFHKFKRGHPEQGH